MIKIIYNDVQTLHSPNSQLHLTTVPISWFYINGFKKIGIH